MTTILEDVTKIKTLCDGLSIASTYAAPLPAPAKRYVGCFAEEGNAEWAGHTHETYATEAEAVEAARNCWEVKSNRSPCLVWACPVEEA